MVITSNSNPTVKDIAKLLSDRKYRERTGLYVVEGRKPVSECVAAGFDVEKIVCTPDFAASFDNPFAVSESVFSHLSSEKSPQGVLAVVKIPQNPLEKPEGCCLLLDRLQDPGNLGTIIRTANAAGYSDIYTVNCTDAYSPKAVRASMGGIFYVKVMSGSEREVLDALEGVPLICADMDGVNVFEFEPPERFCLCIGNEGGGIAESIFKRADKKVRIPMRESCESLNAAVSAGIAMYVLKNN